MRHEPYIGITDFVREQVNPMLSVLTTHLPQGSSRKLHVGVMMSYKTLHDIPTKWSAAFPPKETIASIFFSSDTYNCLHYADYDNDSRFERSLAHAISFGGEHIHAVQLDMIWPDPKKIARALADSHKQIEVILQIGKNALEAVLYNPYAVAEMIRDYDGIIHRILLDKSMGKGLGMDAMGLIPFAERIKKEFPKLGIGAAGGLGPETINLVKPLVEAFPDISIDAQGRLRPSGNALDPIDWKMAETYLIKAIELFS